MKTAEFMDQITKQLPNGRILKCEMTLEIDNFFVHIIKKHDNQLNNIRSTINISITENKEVSL